MPRKGQGNGAHQGQNKPRERGHGERLLGGQTARIEHAQTKKRPHRERDAQSEQIARHGSPFAQGGSSHQRNAQRDSQEQDQHAKVVANYAKITE